MIINIMRYSSHRDMRLRYLNMSHRITLIDLRSKKKSVHAVGEGLLCVFIVFFISVQYDKEL